MDAGLRERLRAALEAADDECHTGCAPSPDRLADAVLVVRDEELTQLQERLDNQAQASADLIEQLGTAEADLKALRQTSSELGAAYLKAEAAVTRVRLLHTPEAPYTACPACADPDGRPVASPCPTVAALDGA